MPVSSKTNRSNSLAVGKSVINPSKSYSALVTALGATAFLGVGATTGSWGLSAQGLSVLLVIISISFHNYTKQEQSWTALLFILL
jgi:glucan biosynthesis protein